MGKKKETTATTPAPTIAKAVAPPPTLTIPLQTTAYIKPVAERYATAVRCVFPHFTSLSPLTGSPDNAVIVLDYIPRELLVEVTSLEALIVSFRHMRAFREVIVDAISRHIRNAADPIWLRIGAYFQPQGKAPVDVFHAFGKLPEYAWIPDQPTRNW